MQLRRYPVNYRDEAFPDRVYDARGCMLRIYRMGVVGANISNGYICGSRFKCERQLFKLFHPATNLRVQQEFNIEVVVDIVDLVCLFGSRKTKRKLSKLGNRAASLFYFIPKSLCT